MKLTKEQLELVNKTIDNARKNLEQPTFGEIKLTQADRSEGRFANFVNFKLILQ